MIFIKVMKRNYFWFAFFDAFVSDLPTTANFQEYHIYTIEKSMVAVVFSFLSFDVFFVSND